MDRVVVSSDLLRQRTDRMRALLGRLGRHAWTSIHHISQNIAPGEFRSPYRFPFGLERDVPRTFTLDDDFSALHTSVVPPFLVLRSLPEAILRGDMSATQSIHHGDATFTVVVDLSRSMLAGCFRGPEAVGLDEPAASKIHALFIAVATYLKLAETTGFSMRVIYLHASRAEEQRPASARNFVQQVLFNMIERLVDGYARTEDDPANTEPFLLGEALAMAATYRHRGVVVVVSDFLDPIAGYRPALGQVASRNRTVLLDVATGEDRRFPVPGWRDAEARRIPTREGARHLELGTCPDLLDAARIRSWNRERRDDRRDLGTIAHRYHADLLAASRTTWKQVATRAMQVFSDRSVG